MLFKRKLDKRVAQERLTEAVLFCSSFDDYFFIAGLADMACELGVMNRKEAESYRDAAMEKLKKQATEKQGKEG